MAKSRRFAVTRLGPKATLPSAPHPERCQGTTWRTMSRESHHDRHVCREAAKNQTIPRPQSDEPWRSVTVHGGPSVWNMTCTSTQKCWYRIDLSGASQADYLVATKADGQPSFGASLSTSTPCFNYLAAYPLVPLRSVRPWTGGPPHGPSCLFDLGLPLGACQPPDDCQSGRRSWSLQPARGFALEAHTWWPASGDSPEVVLQSTLVLAGAVPPRMCNRHLRSRNGLTLTHWWDRLAGSGSARTTNGPRSNPQWWSMPVPKGPSTSVTNYLDSEIRC